MIEFISTIFSDYTIRTVAIGSSILGFVSGALGSFAVLRKQSLLGDTISHAALPGIALGYLLTGSKSPLVLLCGAAIAGWFATYFLSLITRTTRLKTDTSMGLILSVFFGFGLVLLTYIQRLPNAGKAGLDKFLFGQAATLMFDDIVNISVLGAIALTIILLLWKEFKLLCFDSDYGTSLGYPMRRIDILLISLIVVAIVIGLQTVGVVLMSAMVVAPAAAARQWTDKLGIMVFLGGLFGAISGMGGALISSSVPRLPTGPTIVICMSCLVFISIFFAFHRGLVWQWISERRNRKLLRLDAVLLDFYYLYHHHQTIKRGHSKKVLRTMSIGHGGVERSIHELQIHDYISEKKPDQWCLTEKGLARAKELYHQRVEKSE